MRRKKQMGKSIKIDGYEKNIGYMCYMVWEKEARNNMKWEK